MNELILCGSTTSPFVRKVRVALIEKGLHHRFELAPPWSPAAGVERLNPLHQVVAGIAALETEMGPWMPAVRPLRLPAIATGCALGFTEYWLPDLDWRAKAPRLADLSDSLDRIEARRQTRPCLAAGSKFPVL